MTNHNVERAARSILGKEWKTKVLAEPLCIAKISSLSWEDIRDFYKANKYNNLLPEAYLVYCLTKSDNPIGSKDILGNKIRGGGFDFDDSKFREVVVYDDFYVLGSYYRNESFIFNHALGSTGGKGKYIKPYIGDLSDEQFAIYDGLNSSRISILNGGPGTGKSHIIQHLVDNFFGSVVVMAPTAKAAVKIGGRTVHSVLKIDPDDPNPFVPPLDVDLIIVDESSMLDSSLMAVILRAASRSKLLLVGDADQLSPVGHGKPFFDLINRVQTLTLRTIRRQKSESNIPFLCQAIREGDEDQAIDIINSADDIKILPSFSMLYIENEGDFQVIAPQRNTCHELNGKIKNDLNPITPKAGMRFSPGDRIILTKNNRNISEGFLNGQQDVIGAAEKNYYLPGLKRWVPSWVLHEFALLGWAITVHKSQGSEWDDVHIVIPSETYKGMLTRNFIYTAASRAKKHLFFYSSPGMIRMSIRQTENESKTLLKYMIEKSKGENINV